MLRTLRQSGSGVPKMSTLVETQDWVAELVYLPGDPAPLKYMVYVFDEDRTELADQVHAGNTLYIPPRGSQVIEGGAIVLPSGVEEYKAPEETEAEGERRLFDEVLDFLQTLNYVPPGDTSLWLDAALVFQSYVYDAFHSISYRHFEGDLGTGKTRRIESMGLLSYRSILAAGALTASPLFRLIDKYRGTFFVDEFDFRSNHEQWADILKIFLVGYKRGLSVLRSETGRDGNYDAQAFKVFGPKVIATRKPLPDDALQSRCFRYRCELVDPEILAAAGIPLQLSEAHRDRAAHLRNKLLLWRFRHLRHIHVDPDERVAGVEARVQELAQPVLAVFSDDEIRKVVLDHIREHGRDVESGRHASLEGSVVRAVYQLWSKCEATKREAGFSAAMVAAELNEDRPAKEWVRTKRVGGILSALFKNEKVHARGGNKYQYDTDHLFALGQRYGHVFCFPLEGPETASRTPTGNGGPLGEPPA